MARCTRDFSAKFVTHYLLVSLPILWKSLLNCWFVVLFVVSTLVYRYKVILWQNMLSFPPLIPNERT